MYRVSVWLRRTSRHAAAGTSASPLFGSTTGQANDRMRQAASSSSRAAAAAAAAAARDPTQYSWKANPALRNRVNDDHDDEEDEDEAGDDGRCCAPRGGASSARRSAGRPHAQPSRDGGGGDDDENMLLSHRLQNLFLSVATIDPQNRQRRSQGGGAGGSAAYGNVHGFTNVGAWREKYMDHTATSPAAFDGSVDVLQTIRQLQSPSGKVCDAAVLQGRLVGLLFFSSTERSSAFLRRLQSFARRHSPDVVVVAVSMETHEMVDVSRACGFLHCLHRDGGEQLQRDVGIHSVNFVPLPRLCIVDAATGTLVTRSGVTAVTVRPDTCLAAWRRGEAGCTWSDHLRMLLI